MSEHSRRFDFAPVSVTEAQRWVAQLVADLPRDVRDCVTLMVSELATNALLHGGSRFTVRFVLQPDEVRVEVSDDGDGTPTVLSPSAREPSGRGLQLVAALADGWGVVAATAGTGKTVWFRVALSGDGRRSAGRRSGARGDERGRARWIPVRGAESQGRSCTRVPPSARHAHVIDGQVSARRPVIRSIEPRAKSTAAFAKSVADFGIVTRKSRSSTPPVSSSNEPRMP